MKLNLTPQEYRLLLELVYIGDWIVHAHDSDGTREQALPYHMLVQKLYSYAAQGGCDALIEADPESNEYLPSQAFEEQSPAHALIEEYEDHAFWDNLIERLAERDLRYELDTATLEGMSREEYFSRMAVLEEHYSEEFYANGIDRLHLREA